MTNKLSNMSNSYKTFILFVLIYLTLPLAAQRKGVRDEVIWVV